MAASRRIPEPPVPTAVRAPGARRERRPDWGRLLASESADRALDEIARWLAPGSAGLTLAAEELVGVWRAARGEIARTEAGLAARTLELDLLQTLGRRAAEAGSPEELFDATAAVLHGGAPLDLVLAGFREDGTSRLLGYPSRPFSVGGLAAVAARATRFLDSSGEPVAVERRGSGAFDGARGPRDRVPDEELILLPLVRGARPVGCLVVLPSGAPDEGRLRVLYSAANQLSLHLDRILARREAETDRFRAIVDSMPQGVWLADARLRLLQANRSAREMLWVAGLSSTTSVEQLIERLGLGALVERVLAGRAPFAEAEVGVGAERSWSATVSPVRDARNGVAGLVIVLGDISERRRLQNQLTQAEKMSSLGRLIAGVAHELNNPLASIVGYAQLLDRGATDEKIRDRLQILRRESERCRRIVENLLSFARHREPEIRSLSLNEVVSNVVALLQYQLSVTAIRVDVHPDPELPVVRGDAHQLEQVLVNLLTNARHAIRATGRPGRVALRTGRDDSGRVLLEVQDDGPGVPESIRGKIFDPFFTTKPAGEGTGLGLALVSEIVAAHGGTIGVEPAPGGGSLFRLAFPASPSRAAAVPRPPRATGDAHRPGRILVVDDEPALARLICDALAEDGHETAGVADGRSALERLERERFDLVISDIRMPGMDGDELCRQLRTRAPELSGRVILTSGEAGRSGPDVLRKPFDLDELRRAVRDRLGPPEG